MIPILVYFFMFLSVIGILVNPVIPAVFYFMNGIMQPAFIWPWTFPYFSFMSLSKILAIFSILAWMKLAFTQKIDFSIYKNKQSLALLSMWVLMHLSHIFTPYSEYFAGVGSNIVLSSMNTIVIMYFVGLGLLSNADNYKKAFLWMSIMFGFIALYYTYWANDMYLGYRWDMFENGRLISPRGTSIGDQNALSGLIAMGMPFIFLGYFYLKNIFLRWSCLAVLPLLWHSLFLFGSRGAMLALFCTTLLCLHFLKPLKSKDKTFKISEEQSERFKSIKLIKTFVVIGLVAAIIWQGGSMLNRSSSTLAEAQSGGEEPLNPRLVSWSVGGQLIMKYPLLGVGPQRFQMAAQSLFAGKTVHVAHNTFLNFSANTGLPVGLLFLSLFWMNYKNYKYCRTKGIERYPLLEYVNISCSAALIAYFITALFLDLIIFEAFYFILMLNLAKLFVFEKLINPDKDMKDNNDNKMNRHSQNFNKRA